MAERIESEEVKEIVDLDVDETEDEVDETENELEDGFDPNVAVAAGAIGGGVGFTAGLMLGRKIERAKMALKQEAADGEKKPKKEKKSLNPFKGLKFQSPIVRTTEDEVKSEPDEEPKSEGTKADKKKGKK